MNEYTLVAEYGHQEGEFIEWTCKANSEYFARLCFIGHLQAQHPVEWKRVQGNHNIRRI